MLFFRSNSGIRHVTLSTMTTPDCLSDIGQIALTVSDVAKVKIFYGEVLDLRLLFDAGPNLSFYAAGAVRIIVTNLQKSGEARKNSGLYLKTTALETTYEATVGHGAKPFGG